MNLKTSIAVPSLRIDITQKIHTAMMALIMSAFFKPAHYIIGSSLNKIWKLYTLLVCAGFFLFYK